MCVYNLKYLFFFRLSYSFSLQHKKHDFISWYLSYRSSRRRENTLNDLTSSSLHFCFYTGHFYHVGKKQGLVSAFILRLSVVQGDKYGCHMTRVGLVQSSFYGLTINLPSRHPNIYSSILVHVWGCFCKRLAFESVDWSKQIALLIWWATSNQMKVWREHKSWTSFQVREHSSCLPDSKL